MKKNSFYLLVAAVAFIEVGIFWWSVESASPLPSLVAVLFGIAFVYVARMYIDEVVIDERAEKIIGITSLRTLQITWIGLFLFALWVVIEALNEELNNYNRRVGIVGFRLMAILCGIILLYVILSLYYDRKFGAS
ncbi:MAG TPA: DUF2178 domain-containing protein [Methanoregulaceae archaeon]|nr:DUF2178 domain-containing protein [Methanoregulaceae archaeon]